MKKKLKNAILLILATSLILTTLAACQNTAADKSRVETTTVTTTAEPTTVEQTNEPETTTIVTTTVKPPIPHKRSTKNIDPFLELQIREDFISQLKSNRKDDEAQNATIKDVWVEKYFGSFSFGNVMILGGKFFAGPFIGVVSEIVVGEYVFVISSKGIKIYLHQNSKFYNLEKAYETGILTKEEVAEIHIAYYSYSENENKKGS